MPKSFWIQVVASILGAVAAALIVDGLKEKLAASNINPNNRLQGY